MGRERIIWTFLAAAVGLVLFSAVRPVSPDPTENSTSRRHWFFVNKVHGEQTYRVVVLGDSRALRAVAPEEIAPRLPGGGDVLNFAFHAGGMNPEMYDAAERRLDRDGPPPVLVLAPTALAFMPFKQGNEQYRQYLAKPRDEVWFNVGFPAVAAWFQPVPPTVPLRLAFGMRPILELHEEFTADGWIATDQNPIHDFTDLAEHRARLAGNRADPALVAALMDRVRAWSGSGIRVVGFFPPAYAPRVALEDSALGLDPADFAARFEAAGGTWLEFGAGGYETYDGSHLVSASARRLSQDLGDALADLLP